jgi:drug/metabolite transporter (DMT)-like permease
VYVIRAGSPSPLRAYETTLSDITAWPGAAFAALSAGLFGASTPFAKWLLGEGAQPQMLAGLFYLGSGLGLALLSLLRRALGQASLEAPIRRADIPRLAGAVLIGGAVAPALLMLGLKSTPASSASLLLNLEGVATMVIAWLVFKENVDRRLLFGAWIIVAGAALLSWGGRFSVGPGSLAIGLACIGWGVDNNLTRSLSSADPIQIAMSKGLIAGGTNTLLALAAGGRFPSWPLILAAGIIGFLGFGVSLVLYVRALRHLGAARTSAYFSTAPFFGALIAILLLQESITVRLLIAGLAMGVGIYLHLSEAHAHEHAHGELDHEHSHVHDEHHQHAHGSGDPVAEPHSHWHRHEVLVHKHRHYPDLHHHHSH